MPRLDASPGAPYGWRARIGLLQPGRANPNHPYEFYMVAPQGVTLIHVGLQEFSDPRGEFLSEESLRRPIDRIAQGVRLLVNENASAIIQAGVPHITVRGWGVEQELRAEVAALTSVPFIMDPHACVDAMQALNMTRVLMVSPFTDEASKHVIAYMGHAGVQVVAAHRVVPQHTGIQGTSLGYVYQEAKAAYEALNEKVDGIWLPGAAMPTLGIISTIEQDLGLPVVSSKQAICWAALRAARVYEPVPDRGSLFRLQ